MSEIKTLKRGVVAHLRAVANGIEDGSLELRGFNQQQDFERVETEKDIFIPTGHNQLMVLFEKKPEPHERS